MQKSERKKLTSRLYRRFFWLVLGVATPVVVLTAVGLRALHFEEIAVREEAVEKAKGALEAAGSLMLFLNLPAESCQDEKTGFANLEQCSLLKPNAPEEDFVFKMQHYRPNSDLYAPMADYRFQSCLLDENGALLYPKTADAQNQHNSVAGAKSVAWTELEQSHELSRKLYQLFQAQRSKNLSITSSKDQPQGVTSDIPLMFYRLQLDEEWVVWRLQLGESKYQILVGLPLVKLRELTHRLLDPSRRRSGLPFDLPGYDYPFFLSHARPQNFMFTYPRLEDYMQLTVVAEDNRLLIGSTGEDAKWFWATGPAHTSDAGASMRGFLTNDILAISEISRMSIGAFHIAWVIEGGAPRLNGSSQNIVLQVLVRDKNKLMAVVQRHRRWFVGIVGFSSFGALLALMAAWRAFRQQEWLSDMKTNFLSSVSHELRTPIASIRLMAEGLQRGTVIDATKQAEYFRLILQESRRVSGLVENVLDLSRIEQGRKQYVMEPCEITKLFNETVSGLKPYATDKKVSLELKTQGEPCPIDCDALAIQQVLVNLLDNAIKHSPADSTVRIELNFMQKEVCFSVADSGPGIPKEDHEKIFEQFFRRGSELRRETQGAGLGLSIVRHAVEAHGGSITVESEVGHGSRFVVLLPMPVEQGQTSEVTS